MSDSEYNEQVCQILFLHSLLKDILELLSFFLLIASLQYYKNITINTRSSG
jgi:hypothetical protein